MAEMIAIARLRRDGGTQPRAMLDPETVADYAQARRDGAVFPAIGVIYDGTDHWVWDGFHRTAGCEEAGDTEIRADVRPGTRRDAVLLAAGANAAHGLRRSNEDKRRAVLLLLDDPEWALWSTKDIADRCAVSDSFVSNIRRSHSSVESGEYRTFRHKSGKITRMRVASIGSNAPSTRAPISMSEAKLAGLSGDRCVYLVQAGGLTKIGFTTSLLSRVYAIRSTNPDATLVGIVPGADMAVERSLHALFPERRRDTEWFDLAPFDFEAIRAEVKTCGLDLLLDQDGIEKRRAAVAAIGKHQSAVATIRSMPVDALYQVTADLHRQRQDAKKARREEREQELGARIASGNAALVAAGAAGLVYPVLLADPEWRYEPWSRDTGMDRAADNHYPTTPTSEIRKRPVREIAADDAVLFLWATVPMLPDAFAVITDWGFIYKSHFIWVKRRSGAARGPGYWNTNEHELLLVATRGNPPAPAPGTQWPSVIIAPVGRHSAKPDRVYELIESYFPTLPKIELNARTRRAGWEVWGAEAPELLPDAGATPCLGRPVVAELDAYAAEMAAVDLPALPIGGRA